MPFNLSRSELKQMRTPVTKDPSGRMTVARLLLLPSLSLLSEQRANRRLPSSAPVTTSRYLAFKKQGSSDRSETSTAKMASFSEAGFDRVFSAPVLPEKAVGEEAPSRWADSVDIAGPARQDMAKAASSMVVFFMIPSRTLSGAAGPVWPAACSGH